jgi:hypothetical protein
LEKTTSSSYGTFAPDLELDSAARASVPQDTALVSLLLALGLVGVLTVVGVVIVLGVDFFV